MTTNKILEEYLQKTNVLIIQLRSIDEEQLFFLPKRFDSWTIYQHFSHLIQTQIESLNRTLLLLMNSDELCIISENIKWITIANDLNINIQKSIALFESMVSYEISMIKNIEYKNMKEMNLKCKYHGEIINMNLLENIESSVFHIDFHYDYILKNISEYNTEKKFLTTSST